MDSPAGFARLPREIIEIIALLVRSCNAVVRASISCKGWRLALPRTSSAFWRALYSLAKGHIAVLPTLPTDHSHPKAKEVDWFAACSYQGRSARNLLAGRYHTRILDVVPVERPAGGRWSLSFSAGQTKVAVTLYEEVSYGSYGGTTPRSTKIFSIEPGHLDFKTLGPDRVYLNGDFALVGYQGLQGVDLTDGWADLPTALSPQPIPTPPEASASRNSYNSWYWKGRVVATTSQRGKDFVYFDLRRNNVLSRFKLDIGDIYSCVVHENYFFFMQKERPDRFMQVMNYIDLLAFDDPMRDATVVRKCGPASPAYYGVSTKFHGDCILFADLNAGTTVSIFDFKLRKEIERFERPKQCQCFELTDNFAFTLSSTLQVFKRGTGVRDLELVQELRFPTPPSLPSLHCLDDGHMILAVNSTKVMMYDFGATDLNLDRPVTGVLWKRDIMRDVSINPSNMLEDCAAVLNIYDIRLRSFFAPFPGGTLRDPHLVLIMVGSASAANPSVVDAFWSGEVSSTKPGAVKAAVADFAKTHKRGTPPPKATPQPKVGIPQQTTSSFVSMVVLKRQGDTFDDFPTPTDEAERQKLAALVGSFVT